MVVAKTTEPFSETLHDPSGIEKRCVRQHLDHEEIEYEFRDQDFVGYNRRWCFNDERR
jgi:hypothetical protein